MTVEQCQALGREFLIRHDLAQFEAAFRHSGLLAAGGAMARAYLLLTLTGQNVPRRLVGHVRHLASAAGQEPGQPVSDDLWQRAIATFDWPRPSSKVAN